MIRILKYLNTKSLTYVGLLSFALVISSSLLWQAIFSNRGLIAYFYIQKQLITARQQLSFLDEEYADLEHRLRLLNPSALDRDLVDELARRNLGLAENREILIIP